MLIFLDTKIRPSELLTLTIDRTNLVRGSLLVEGKVEKEREVCAEKTLRKEMSRWLKRRGLCLYEGRCLSLKTGDRLKSEGWNKSLSA